MSPDATPEELLRRHLDQRTSLANDLNLEVLTDLSLQNRFRRIAESMVMRREVLLNRDILVELPEAKRIEGEGKWEWLGDYPQEAVRRAKGKNLRPLMELSPTYRLPQSDALEKMREADNSGSTEKSDG
jgi:hypothetical protein